jgi:hypothetical protein
MQNGQKKLNVLHNPKRPRIRNDHDEQNHHWIGVQKVAFTRWSNSYLKSRSLLIEDLSVDLADGVVLINLLEILTGNNLPRFNKHPKMRIQRLSNLNLGIRFLKEQRLRLINVGAEDIEAGNIKIILGLLWSIIVKYQIKDSSNCSSNGSINQYSKLEDQDQGEKELLLAFVNTQIESYQLTAQNFTSDFCDGTILLALVDSMTKGRLISSGSLIDSDQPPISRAHRAVTTAETLLDIPILIEPQDIVSHPQEHSMMTYISFFRKLNQKEALKLLEDELAEDKQILADEIIEEKVSIPSNDEQKKTINLNMAQIIGYRMAPIDPSKKMYELTVGCTHLVKRHWKGKSDPMVGLFEKSECKPDNSMIDDQIVKHSLMSSHDFMLVDMTEIIQADHDPVFQKPLRVNYDSISDKEKEFRVVVWDTRGAEKSEQGIPIVSDKYIIGYSDTKLSSIIETADSKGMAHCVLKGSNQKQDKKLRQRESTVNLSLKHRGLRQANITSTIKDCNRKGDKLNLQITLNGYRDLNPLIAVFEDKVLEKKTVLLSQTEFVRNPKEKSVTFSKQLSIYIGNSAHWKQRRLRFCVYGVDLCKKDVRKRGSVVVPVGEDHLLSYHDVTLGELVNSLRSGEESSEFQLFKDKKQGRRSSLSKQTSPKQTSPKAKKGYFFTLRGWRETETTQVTFVNVLQPEKQSLTLSPSHRYGRVVDLHFRCYDLYALDLTDSCDPILALFEKNLDGDWVLVGTTEFLKSEHNPIFMKSLRIFADLSQDKEYRVNVYDVDIPKLDDNKKMLGSAGTLPVVSALDSDLASEEQLVGITYFTLKQLLEAESCKEAYPANLFFPTRKVNNNKNSQEVAEDWYKIKRLSDKKSRVAITASVSHLRQDNSDYLLDLPTTGMPISA